MVEIELIHLLPYRGISPMSSITTCKAAVSLFFSLQKLNSSDSFIHTFQLSLPKCHDPLDLLLHVLLV